MSNEKKGFTDLSLKHLINKIKSTFVNKEDAVATFTIEVDTTPTKDSENLVTSGGVAKALSNKQNILTEGTDYLNPSHIEDLVNTIRKASFIVVEELPTPSELTIGKIYLIPSESKEPKEENLKDEYITIKNSNIYSWEKIGNTNINLDNYYTKKETDENFPKKTEVSAEITKAIQENTDPKGILTIDGTEYTASKQTITIVTNGITSTFNICALS